MAASRRVCAPPSSSPPMPSTASRWSSPSWPARYAAHISRDYPTNIRVPARESGLPKDTVFLCFQLWALDPTRFRDPRTGLITPVGQLSAARMAEVDTALRAVLSL